MKLACATDGASPLKRVLRRPKGRCHIMVPAGGANAEGWLAFRDVLARIEAYTSRAAPVQVSSVAHALALLRHALSIHGKCQRARIEHLRLSARRQFSSKKMWNHGPQEIQSLVLLGSLVK